MNRRSLGLSSLALLFAGPVAMFADRAEQVDSEPGALSPVGSWVLGITPTGEAEDPHLATLAWDGTFVETARPVQAAPVDAPFKAIFPSPGHGVWAASGARTLDVAFTRLLSDENGTYLGTVPAHASMELSADGRTCTGSVTFETIDPAGTVVGSGRGTIRGERIDSR